MAMTISTNPASLNKHRSISGGRSLLSTSLLRLSSGLRTTRSQANSWPQNVPRLLHQA